MKTNKASASTVIFFHKILDLKEDSTQSFELFSNSLFKTSLLKREEKQKVVLRTNSL